jgi:GNAT superfamily N-acetyltransferase
MTVATSVQAQAENVWGADAVQLMDELTVELARLYNVADGSAGFVPSDVEVPRAAFVVARIDGVAVGCGALRPLDADSVEVKRVYTRAAYRRLGVAQAIMQELERLAKEFGYTNIKLQTGPLQPEAAQLYASTGYYRIPIYHGDWDQILAFQKDL